MPREKRAKARPAPAPQVIATEELPPWRTVEKIRFWCPLCGMVADEDRLDGSPYPVKVKRHVFGGKLPGGAGFMRYLPVQDESQPRRIMARLAELAKELPARLTLAEYEEEKTFAGWCREARRRFGLERDYDVVLHGLTLALTEQAGFDVTPGELDALFHNPLADATPEDTYADLAAGMARALSERAKHLPYYMSLDETLAVATAADLAQIPVPFLAVEAEVAGALKKEKIRRGTKKYREWMRENAEKIVSIAREEFERAKAWRLAEAKARLREWQEDAGRAANYREILERALDIAVEIHVLAEKKIPAALLAEVTQAGEALQKAAGNAAIVERAVEKLEEKTFEEYVQERGTPLVKEAWEALQG